MTAIALTCIPHTTAENLPYQHLHIALTAPDGLVEPADLKNLTLPSPMIWSQGVVLEGKAPIWVYGYLVHECHPAAWVACFDPRLGNNQPNSGGAVVISTHSRSVQLGQVLLINLPNPDSAP